MYLNKNAGKEKGWELLGISGHIAEVRKNILDAAPKNMTILIEGPTGTGKELIAREIYKRSQRQNKPFITLNCGAYSKDLFQSELFGHEKGAFTGAFQEKQGQIELAGGGTLFLDEIGELDPDNQIKLLRFLQEGRFYRVGGTKEKTIDIQLISATNKNLIEEITKAHFREDLYYRISYYIIKTDYLKNRPEDVVFMVNHFANNKNIKLDAKVKFLLYSYTFPGNVREFLGLIENYENYEYIKKQMREKMVFQSQSNQIDYSQKITIRDILGTDNHRYQEEEKDRTQRIKEELYRDKSPNNFLEAIAHVELGTYNLKQLVEFYEIITLLWSKVTKQEIANLLKIRQEKIDSNKFDKYYGAIAKQTDEIMKAMPMRIYPHFTFFLSKKHKYYKFYRFNPKMMINFRKLSGAEALSVYDKRIKAR